MKIPKTGQNSGQLFCLQKQVVDATKHGKTEEWGHAENYCGGKPKWAFESCGYILYRPDMGDDFKALYADLIISWGETGVYGFYSLGSAELAKEIMENASRNGEFDSRDGYNNLLYRVRHEYRIVLVEFDIKTSVC